MAAAKTTAEMLAAPDEFKAAYERARLAFEQIDGVVSVGYGLKQVAGEFGSQGAIIVFVREKRPAESLAPAQRIPATFEGYATDVRVVPARRVLACENTAKYKTIQGGIQICNEGITTVNADGSKTIDLSRGTVACIVRRRNDPSRDNTYILSNAHVMYAKGHAGGSNIFHPEPPEGTNLGTIQHGGAERDISWTPTPDGTVPPIDVYIDCAIARVNIDCFWCDSRCTEDKIEHAESIIDIVQVTPPDTGMDAAVHVANRLTDIRNVVGDLPFAIAHTPVFKVGRTTGKTEGFVTSVNTTWNKVDPANPTVILATGHNVIEIAFDVAKKNACQTVDFFAGEGDSGSLVIDVDQKVVGLLFGGALPTDPPGTTCVAAHIVPVLDHLGICIPCKGPGPHQHGGSLATDSSGIAPAPLPPQLTGLLPAGQIVFTADGAAPVHVDDDEVRRMRAHLEEFRNTRFGPVVHEIFRNVRREIGYLVRNVRPVKAAWARHQGPAWLAHFLNHIAGHAPTIPHEIKGVTRRALLVKMREVLSLHGSDLLVRALAEQGDEVLEMLTFDGCDSVADIVAWVQERERERECEEVT